MEYVEGENLETLTDNRGRPLPIDEALRYIGQIGSALDYIHKLKPTLLHRDVKPKNIVLRQRTREAVLVDFGNAKEVRPGASHSMHTIRSEGYSAIEMYSDAKKGTYTDVYSLAATLYYLLTAEHPISPQKRVVENLVPPKQHNSLIPNRINDAILNAMELKPDHRVKTVTEFLDRLGISQAGGVSLFGKLFGKSANGDTTAERQEAERLKREKAEQQARAEAERRKREQVEREAKAEAEKLKAKAETERRRREQVEQQAKAEAERLQQEKAQAEAERLRQERERQRLEAELQKAQIEKQRLAAALEKEKQAPKTAPATPPKAPTQYQPEVVTNRFVSPAQPKSNTLTLDCGKGVSLELIRVAAGKFMMGSNEYSSEKPIHEVRLNEFYLGKYAVTNAQWQAVMGSLPQAFKELDDKFKGEDHPIVRINWHEARQFCEMLAQKSGQALRLPTEAEWEYAARGGNQSQGYTYAGSNNLDEVGWYGEDWSKGSTHPVQKKNPNELGIYDMSGNVWEWCLDEWHDSYEKKPDRIKQNGNEAWGDLNVNKNDNRFCVLRGGSWLRRYQLSFGGSRQVHRGRQGRRLRFSCCCVLWFRFCFGVRRSFLLYPLVLFPLHFFLFALVSP
jgi:formylglycine-generating enzyme required for sulfatase activity